MCVYFCINVYIKTIYGLTSDYIINGTPLLFHYLSILFPLMLSHCYAPSSFCISTMIIQFL